MWNKRKKGVGRANKYQRKFGEKEQVREEKPDKSLPRVFLSLSCLPFYLCVFVCVRVQNKRDFLIYNWRERARNKRLHLAYTYTKYIFHYKIFFFNVNFNFRSLPLWVYWKFLKKKMTFWLIHMVNWTKHSERISFIKSQQFFLSECINH